MVTAIRKAARGESYFSQSLSSYIKSAIVRQKEELVNSDSSAGCSISQTYLQDDYISSLTSRELEVLELIAEGLRNKEIAECLGITKRTVDYHIGNILSKLEVKSRLEVILKYKKG